MGQRGALYCRVSTSDQSCDRQERDLLALAERAGFEGIGIWKETMSGAKDSRPERRKVMALAQDRRLDAILVTELTRWGRSTLDLVRTLQSLSQNPLLGQIRHPGSHPIIDNNRAGQYFSIV